MIKYEDHIVSEIVVTRLIRWDDGVPKVAGETITFDLLLPRGRKVESLLIAARGMQRLKCQYLGRECWFYIRSMSLGASPDIHYTFNCEILA